MNKEVCALNITLLSQALQFLDDPRVNSSPEIVQVANNSLAMNSSPETQLYSFNDNFQEQSQGSSAVS